MIGTCQDENVVEEIFGTISEFARQVEENGNNFIYGRVVISYDSERDIHTFSEK